MPTIVTDRYDNTVVHSNNHTAADLNPADLVEEGKKLSAPGVKGEMVQWFFDGIRMSYSDLTYRGSNEVEWKGSMDVISMGFNLNGRLSIVHGNCNPFTIGTGQHNIFYIGEAEGLMRSQEQRSEMFMVQFNREAFIRLTENTTTKLMLFRDAVLDKRASALAVHNEFIDFGQRSVIDAILNCQYRGGIRKMFFLSKCIELLVLQSEQFDRSEARQYAYCKTAYDKERIVFAREHLLKNIADPPTLPALAKIAGLNEFKLKKGFKEVFGATVFNYLTACRMEIAKNDLLQGEKNVNQIAYELGYSSPQHFNRAFKKVYNVTPGTLHLKFKRS